MENRKRNHFLDTNESEEEDYTGSELGAEDSRTADLSRRGVKRRKTSVGSIDEPSDEDSPAHGGDDDNHESRARPSPPPSKLITTNQSPKNLLSSDPMSPRVGATVSSNGVRKKRRPGVIYLSRIPPFMKPTTVRTLLAPYGTITQLFLTPEAPAAYAARKRQGGNKKRSFIDGWVEFKHKRHAKACVDGINGQIVGGKKGGWYRDDVWNAKYLRGFSWDDLMAGVRQEEREREERVRVGVAKDKREREAFLRSLESAKVEETRDRKRKQRRSEGGSKSLAEDDGLGGSRKTFQQRDVQGQSTEPRGEVDDVTRVLSKIF